MGAISPSKMPKAKNVTRTDSPESVDPYAQGGLYENINAKRKRIAAGSGEKMRKPGTPGAPTAAAFKASAKTAKR
jgi:hypothetical protein